LEDICPYLEETGINMIRYSISRVVAPNEPHLELEEETVGVPARGKHCLPELVLNYGILQCLVQSMATGQFTVSLGSSVVHSLVH
jgi:hypothetical protein